MASSTIYTMNRRAFFRHCLLTSLVMSTHSLAELRESPSRGEFSELEETLISMKVRLRSGNTDPRQLSRNCREKSSALNGLLSAVLEINPDVDAIATRSQRQGLLGGLPILVKDNIATGDMMMTSAGSAALSGLRCSEDADVVRKLRQAGAVLFGKSNMSEWANFRSSNSSSGWSARGGQCRNPYALNRSPCGSSSGSAVAVSVGIVPAAIGSETVGSILCPSGMCGIVGMKPTYGSVSNLGVIPGASSFDTLGPMATTVSDVALLLSAITIEPSDFSSCLRRGGMKLRRIGVDSRSFGVDSRVDRMIEEQIEVLKSLGATVVSLPDVPCWSDLSDSFLEVLRYEFKDGINGFLGKQPAQWPIRCLADVISFNRTHPDLENLGVFGQDLLIAAQSAGPLTDRSYRSALAEVRSSGDLASVFKRHKVDAVVGPTNGPAWVIDPFKGDQFQVGNATAAAVSGCPSITVPGGFVQGLPIGVTFSSPRWSEPSLLAMAYDYEQETRHRRLPALATSTMS